MQKVIVGKILKTISGANGAVELIIGEHTGFFSSEGEIKLVANPTAAMDLFRTLGQRVSWKGGPLAPKMGRWLFNGKRIVISIY